MDRARLRQYLNYDFAGAESAYRQILSEVGNMPGREFVAAAAERNLAECVLAQAPTEEPARQEAQELLLDAGARLSTKPTEHLRAEIAYVQAKLAEGEESNATLRSCARLSSASIFSQRAHRDSGHE